MKTKILAAAVISLSLLAGTERFVDVSKVDCRYLSDASGKTWIPIGCNICFDRLERPTAEARALFDGWMTAFAASGGDFMRVWLSCPFVEVMPEKAGVYSPEATENLKWLVKRSEELGIRLKFTFENFRGTGPTTSDKNPENGIVSFKRPVYTPYAKNMREWFASEACFGIYRDRARHIADAVKDSPAVIAVELWNEVTSTGAGLSLIASWTDRMMPEIQKLFPKQMVLQNLGSFSDPGSELHYDWLAQVKGNAYLQAHRYLDPGAAFDVCRGPMDVLCADSIRELIERRSDMPVFLAETGAVKPRHTGPSLLYPKDKEGLLIHDEIFAAFFAGSAGSGQPWHWDHQYIAGNHLWYHFKWFKRAIEGLDPAAEHFRPFHTETHRLRLWGLRGEKTTVVWLRDKQADWVRILEKGEPPQAVSGERLPSCCRATDYKWYLPWEDRTMFGVKDEIPGFTRSAIVRFPTSRAY